MANQGKTTMKAKKMSTCKMAKAMQKKCMKTTAEKGKTMAKAMKAMKKMAAKPVNKSETLMPSLGGTSTIMIPDHEVKHIHIQLPGDTDNSADAIKTMNVLKKMNTLLIAVTAEVVKHEYDAEIIEKHSWNQWQGDDVDLNGGVGEVNNEGCLVRDSVKDKGEPARKAFWLAKVIAKAHPGVKISIGGHSCGAGAAADLAVRLAAEGIRVSGVFLLCGLLFTQTKEWYDGLDDEKKTEMKKLFHEVPVHMYFAQQDDCLPHKFQPALFQFFSDLTGDVRHHSVPDLQHGDWIGKPQTHQWIADFLKVAVDKSMRKTMTFDEHCVVYGMTRVTKGGTKIKVSSTEGLTTGMKVIISRTGDREQEKNTIAVIGDDTITLSEGLTRQYEKGFKITENTLPPSPARRSPVKRPAPREIDSPAPPQKKTTKSRVPFKSTRRCTKGHAMR